MNNKGQLSQQRSKTNVQMVEKLPSPVVGIDRNNSSHYLNSLIIRQQLNLRKIRANVMLIFSFCMLESFS